MAGRATMEDPVPEPLAAKEIEEICRKLDARHNSKLRVVKGRANLGEALLTQPG